MRAPLLRKLRMLIVRILARPIGPLPSRAVVLWWEARRVPYNAIVGAVGLVSATIMIGVAFTCESRGGAPIGLPDPPAFAIVGALLYGVLANICYTGGWITEVVVAKVWSAETTRFGPIAFTLGTAFSVLVTLIPPGLVIVSAAITSCGTKPAWIHIVG
jgi:hypothetical protein